MGNSNRNAVRKYFVVSRFALTSGGQTRDSVVDVVYLPVPVRVRPFPLEGIADF